MNANTKKIVTWLVVAFVLFFVLGQPEQAADIVQSGVNVLHDAADAAITFMRSLAT